MHMFMYCIGRDEGAFVCDGNALEVLGRIHNELVTVVTTRK